MDQNELYAKYLSAIQEIYEDHAPLRSTMPQCDCEFCEDHRESQMDGYEGEVGFKEQRLNKGENR